MTNCSLRLLRSMPLGIGGVAIIDRPLLLIGASTKEFGLGSSTRDCASRSKLAIIMCTDPECW